MSSLTLSESLSKKPGCRVTIAYTQVTPASLTSPFTHDRCPPGGLPFPSDIFTSRLVPAAYRTLQPFVASTTTSAYLLPETRCLLLDERRWSEPFALRRLVKASAERRGSLFIVRSISGHYFVQFLEPCEALISPSQEHACDRSACTALKFFFRRLGSPLTALATSLSIFAAFMAIPAPSQSSSLSSFHLCGRRLVAGFVDLP